MVKQKEKYNGIDEMDIRIHRLHFNSVVAQFASNKIPLRNFFKLTSSKQITA